MLQFFATFSDADKLLGPTRGAWDFAPGVFWGHFYFIVFLVSISFCAPSNVPATPNLVGNIFPFLIFHSLLLLLHVFC